MSIQDKVNQLLGPPLRESPPSVANQSITESSNEAKAAYDAAEALSARLTDLQIVLQSKIDSEGIHGRSARSLRAYKNAFAEYLNDLHSIGGLSHKLEGVMRLLR